LHFNRFKSHRGRRFFLFFFFILIFGLIPLLVIGGITLLALYPPPFIGRHSPPERPVGLVCGGAAFLTFTAVFLSAWARRRVANPLAGIMEAAEKVTEGDLSARVQETNGPFTSLESTFNRMLDELEQSDQQRRNLTADVAHELNTPLHIIQGYLEGIADGIYQPDEATINMLLDETNLLSRLVEDLRTLSLAEAGQLPLQTETIRLEEFLADLKTSFSGQSEEAGIDLQVENPADLTLVADPSRLDQIVSNLVVNALRHTPSGGEINISAGKVPEGVQIQVADSGEGIAPEDLTLIFNRFWRKDKSRERADTGGHGLGLAIAQQLVHAHGGTISVESEPGSGTIFTLVLPDSPG
jgi:signal transduction histidine kinase